MVDLIIACILDLILGDPYNFPHPVKFMGNLISTEEKISRKFFKGRQLYFAGFLIVAFNIFITYYVIYYILELVKFNQYLYHIVNIYLLYTTVAARCLRDEAIKIYEALKNSINEARYRLSFIVGRDTKNLDEGEIIRATVETVAENTSDGVIAPLFYALFGTPFAFIYKMVNTMDSMLGYLNEKYRFIGFFPAKTDDLLNFIPARITGFLMVLSGAFKYNTTKSFVDAASDVIFKNREYIKKSKEYIKEQRKVTFRNLSSIKNIKPYKTDCNFILIKLLKYDENYIYEKLLKKDIFIRKCSSFEGLDNSFIRIAIKTKELNDIILNELKNILGD